MTYDIGTPNQPWTAGHVAAWRARQVRRRSHARDVLAPLATLGDMFERLTYGHIDAQGHTYPLVAVKSRDWRDGRPRVLVTGGVHGYETSGVHGALRFLLAHAPALVGQVDLLVVPCVSPWGYETVQRWNVDAVDPNRAFREGGAAPEAQALMALLAPWRDSFTVHVDLHETTDTDETEFGPAKAARDGTVHVSHPIPDGFYLVDDTEQPHPEFQAAVLAAVAQVTHIAAADAHGALIGSPMVAPGVIRYPLRALGLCAGVTDAPCRTTTEVYPDSPRTTPEACIAAQVAAVRAAIDFVRGG
jgi:hypothetical protein